MKSMVVAEFAMLLHLNAVWMLAFIFVCGIVALFALGAR
jgi:hypothetical protein